MWLLSLLSEKFFCLILIFLKDFSPNPHKFPIDIKEKRHVFVIISTSQIFAIIIFTFKQYEPELFHLSDPIFKHNVLMSYSVDWNSLLKPHSLLHFVA